MPCSAVTLSLATISGVVSAALLAIAVGTDNWQLIRVNRIEIEKQLSTSEISADDFHDQGIYYTRSRGLFRTCYPDDRPNSEALYRSPFETQCENVDFHLFDEGTEDFGSEEMRRLHMARSMVALFFVSFLLMICAFFTGVAGCWRRSPANVSATAFLMLGACVLAAVAMGLWHAVDYLEEQKLRVLPYKASWTVLLEEQSQVTVDWSYFVAWVGTGMSAISFCMFMGASACMRSEHVKEETKQMPYMMPVYPQKAQYAQYGAGYGYGYNYPPQYSGHYNY